MLISFPWFWIDSLFSPNRYNTMFYCCLFGVLHFKLDYWGACLRWVRLVSGETILQAKTTPIVGGARTQVLAGHWGKRAKPLRHHCLLSLFMLILNYLSVVLTCWVERCVVAVAKTCLSLTYDEEQILHYELPADLLDRFKDINHQNFDPYNMEYGVNRWTAQLLVCVLYRSWIVWQKLGLRQSWFLVLFILMFVYRGFDSINSVFLFSILLLGSRRMLY